VVANPEAPDAPYDPLPEAQRLEALPSELPLIPPFPEAAR
jgi:hypothetical protein